MATPSEFEVPLTARICGLPRRCCRRAVIAPETSLWFNLEVSATRFPDRAAYLFFGRAVDLTAQLRDDALALAGWLQSAGVEAGDRVAVFMQNCPQFPTALYAHPARRRGGRAGEPDEPRRGVQALHQRPRDQGRDLQRRPGGDRRRRQRGAARERARCALSSSRAIRDAMPAGAIADRPTRRRRRWTPGCAADRRAAGRLLALDRRASPRSSRPARTRRSPTTCALLPYTSGTTGLPEGLHAHASHADAQRGVGGQWGRRRPRGGGPRRRADVPHHRHALQRARLGLLGLDAWS